MNLIEQIARHLAQCGFGTIANERHDGNIHWGRMPDQPDDCICVYSTDTAYPGSPQGARVQIMNRASDPREAYETSAGIAAALAEWDGFLAGDGAQVSVSIINSAHGMGPDAKMREIYVSNIRVRYCG